jgi:hypothetical protein
MLIKAEVSQEGKTSDVLSETTDRKIIRIKIKTKEEIHMDL